MIILLLIYSHAAAGMLGYLLCGWTEYRSRNHGDLLEHFMAIVGLAICWPLIIYIFITQED